MIKAVNIQGVKVPNPLALKFEVADLLLTPGAYTYTRDADASASPLAEKLFQFSYVTRVFIAKNFITVSKEDEEPTWDELMSEVRIVIKKHLESRQPIFNFDASQLPELPALNGMDEKIREAIDTVIQPATWTDGGEITFESFADGVVHVQMHGACVECPFAPRTLKHGVEVALKRQFPEVVSVTSSDVNWDETLKA